jgi:hypothetical protein
LVIESLKTFSDQPEQSQNITGYINNISMEVNQTGTMLPINSSKGHVFLKELMKPRLFRYLKIQKQDIVLTLCEVKLYEAGKYTCIHQVLCLTLTTVYKRFVPQPDLVGRYQHQFITNRRDDPLKTA